MQVLFYRYQNLIGIDRLYEIVGNLATHSLIHNIFLLALGNHNHRRLRQALLQFREGFESGKSRHVLVEDNKVERLGKGHIERVASVIGSDKLVALVPEKQQVGLEEVDFVIGPQYSWLAAHMMQR